MLLFLSFIFCLRRFARYRFKLYGSTVLWVGGQAFRSLSTNCWHKLAHFILSPTWKLLFSWKSSIKPERRVDFLAHHAKGRREESCFVWGIFRLFVSLEAHTNTCNFGRLGILFFFFFNFIIFRKLDLDCSLFPGRLLTQFKQGKKTRTTKMLKNIWVKQTIQNIHVLCWFLLAAVCLQMSGKWSQEALYVKI